MTGWGKRALRDVCGLQNGRSFKKSEWSDSGLPIIRIQNLNNPDAPFNHFAGTYDDRIAVAPGDLLFSWSGTVGSSFGPHIWEGRPSVLNQHIFRVTLDDCLDKRFAFYALKRITADVERSVNGAVGLVHISKTKLGSFTIPVPSLSPSSGELWRGSTRRSRRSRRRSPPRRRTWRTRGSC